MCIASKSRGLLSIALIGMWLLPLNPLILASETANALAPDENVFDVPRWIGGSSGGALSDWDGNGLQVKTLCCVRGIAWPKATAAPSMQLAWNASGLLVSVIVHHAHPWECDYVRHLFLGDSVEFFVSPAKGSRNRYMLIISPGLDSRHSEPRHCFFADPSEEAEEDLSDFTFECARSRSLDGYTIKVLLPWSNLHIEPAVGTELALQVYVMEAEPNRTPVVAMWNPVGESYLNPYATQRIRLTQIAGAPVFACATAQDNMERAVRTVRIVALKEDAGKQFELSTADAGVVYGTLAIHGMQSYSTLSVPLSEVCHVNVDSTPIPMTVIPAQDDVATTISQKLQCLFRSCVFQGQQFPPPYLEGAQHYRVVKVAYYDSKYNPVETAVVPGRYGAVIGIMDSKGRTTRRYRTLFRVGGALGPWRKDRNDLSALPGMLAAASDVTAITPVSASGNRDLSFLSRNDALANPDTAALSACLYSAAQANAPDVESSDFRAVDRQWWVGLKRKINGWDREFPGALACPGLTDGNPATVVHVDSDQSAGIDAEKVRELDQICRNIVGAAGEPIAVCLVRHGVVFFNHAYGKINGRPLALDDPCDIQSATKPLGGALMMEVINSGLIHEDEAIDKILPSFRGIPVRRPMVIRDLYDHLSGLTGDWGDQIHDTDEIIAGYYSALDVGNYSYNEVGFALGGKIIEAVTGEALPQFARHHLLDPLGMDHTRVTNSGGHNATTSRDYAKFGQMLLNRGAYGNMRFFSEKTFNDMIPAGDGSNRRGTGLMWMNWQKYGFSTGAFGHNAGNSSILAIDPPHDLVVVIVSAGSRKDFSLRAAPFYRGIIGALR
jgi:CubicO group peptidase (beta-lactamase class C family)